MHTHIICANVLTAASTVDRTPPCISQDAVAIRKLQRGQRLACRQLQRLEPDPPVKAPGPCVHGKQPDSRGTRTGARRASYICTIIGMSRVAR
jgi:hypothetical protein